MIEIRHLFILLSILLVFSVSCRYLRIPDEKAKLEFSRKDLFPHFMYMSVDHVDLRYVKSSSDTLPTLFFIHGLPESCNGYLEYVMDTDLLKHFRIIAIDRPGFGYSNFGHAYYLSDQARLGYGIVKKEENGKPSHLIGRSLGGPVVAKLEQDHPGAYASVTLLVGSISSYDEPKEKWRVFLYIPRCRGRLGFVMRRSGILRRTFLKWTTATIG